MWVRVAWTRKRDEVGLPGWILLLPVRDALLLLTSHLRTTPSQGALFFLPGERQPLPAAERATESPDVTSAAR